MAYHFRKVVWHHAKNVSNQRKHGLSFEDASVLFRTREFVSEYFDDASSLHEDRFVTMGPIAGGIVKVVWTEPEEGTLRIISARWATPRERRFYFSQRRQSHD